MEISPLAASLADKLVREPITVLVLYRLYGCASDGFHVQTANLEFSLNGCYFLRSRRLKIAGLAYPSTRYDPSPVVDLASKKERERLSPSALKAFFNIVDRWGVRDQDARQLLGGVTNGPYYEMKKHPSGRVLDADKLLRISYLVGIFKALNILHGQKLADEWVRLPNTNRIFGGTTPLAYMAKGGAPAMQIVRRLLDARRGGM
jgi:Protein of unknown function (DUF2384)